MNHLHLSVSMFFVTLVYAVTDSRNKGILFQDVAITSFFSSFDCTAAKTAMNLFSHMSEATNREKELMKACTDPELVASIVGNVKITAAGLAQLKQKQKKGKKSSAKQGN